MLCLSSRVGFNEQWKVHTQWFHIKLQCPTHFFDELLELLKVVFETMPWSWTQNHTLTTMENVVSEECFLTLKVIISGLQGTVLPTVVQREIPSWISYEPY